MSSLPEAKDDFYSAAFYHHRWANTHYKDGKYAPAYKEAMEFSENALKAILVKNSLYDDHPIWQGGDRHHYSENLWSKIKQSNLISFDDQNKLDQLLPGLFKVDISSPTSHIDCASEQVTSFRYRDMDDFIGEQDAKLKVDLLNQTLDIIKQYL